MSRTYPSSLRATVAATVSDVKNLWINNLIEESHGMLATATAAREARQELHARLSYCARPYTRSLGYCNVKEGTLVVALLIWQRDCDCVEGYSRMLIPATVQVYDEVQYGEWEGPHNIIISDPARECNRKLPPARDRILEAFENGNSYSV